MIKTFITLFRHVVEEHSPRAAIPHQENCQTYDKTYGGVINKWDSTLFTRKQYLIFVREINGDEWDLDLSVVRRMRLIRLAFVS
jgi:hypothetical protein